ncbi:MAG TPA: hypothetical protein VM124_03535 [Candidatus Limnocylindrales bacterium]|nr:hypothetical protein [Candidatus Limnocylindrales bacterium]
MFGHDDDNQQQPAQDTNTLMQAAMPEPLGDNNPPSAPASDSSVSNGANTAGAPTMSAPHIVTSSDVSPTDAIPSPPAVSPPQTTAAGGDDLLNLKQQALQHLSPLVGQLDQTPEERFRTTMMMIQASDDRSLIKTAFEAAQEIKDDKARAQALLDIINEINYFTQHQ